MSSIKKHPSWETSTASAQSISLAFSAFLRASASLESMILTEFLGYFDNDSAERVMRLLSDSKQHIRDAKKYLEISIKINEKKGLSYQKDFSSLSPRLLASVWDGSLLVECRDDTYRIVHELSIDSIAPTRRFVETLKNIENLTSVLQKSVNKAVRYAKIQSLRPALEKNIIPLQADMVLTLSTWLQFMREYLVHSVATTHIAFTKNKRPMLIAS